MKTALMHHEASFAVLNTSLTLKNVGFAAILLAIPALNPVLADGPSGDFADRTLNGWKEKSFAGNTDYELVDEKGTQVLRGYTKGNASILYKKESIDLTKTPVINWSWKVDKIYQGIDERSRSGDDFPARLYVVVKMGLLPWDTLAINYVWSSTEPVGESWPNPFTKKAQMISVQSGDSNVGEWVTQRRHIAEDFQNAFGVDTKKITGYAVMVDGDNANKEATAWFGNISFETVGTSSLD